MTSPVTSPTTPVRAEEAGGGPPGPPGAPRGPARHRRWPWIVLGVVVVLVVVTVVGLVSANHAHEVSMQQAEQQLGTSAKGVAGRRPAPGVYRYTGSGTEHLSLPPLSQPEGPVMPASVTLAAKNCWVFRIDYSTHHWQTWDYCLHGDDLWEAGGQTWQLWSIGPFNITNTSTFTCIPRTMAVPASRRVGQRWHSSCTGTNTSVKGTTVSAGPYEFLGNVTMKVGGRSVVAAHFLRLRTDSGAQKGTERSEVWFDAANGLPLRVRQAITITTATEFGTTTYTQSGVFVLSSLTPYHG